MRTRPIITTVLLALPAAVSNAWEGTAQAPWSLNGYGTLGAVHSSEERADYLLGVADTKGPGRSGNPSLELDSRLGAQLSVHPTSRLSAVAQVLIEHDGDGDFEPTVEWANVRYELSPALSVRAGRIEVDTFLVSDHRKVGFALPWVRPPVEVYGQIPVSRSDGVDLTYRFNRGNFSYRAHVSVGENNQSGIESRGHGFSNTFEWKDTTIRATYMEVKLEIDELDVLFDGFAQFGPEGLAVSRAYDPNGEKISMATFGARYDPGRWFVMGEWNRSWTDSVFGRASAWYLSGGRRIGDVTPYLTYANADRLHDKRVNGLRVDAYPPALAPAAAGLNGVLAALRGGAAVQETWTVGARWDVTHSVDLKVQYDRVDVDDGSPGTFGNVEPGYRPNGTDLLSFAVDFVF